MRELYVMLFLISLGCMLVTIPDEVDRQKMAEPDFYISTPAWRPLPKHMEVADASDSQVYN